MFCYLFCELWPEFTPSLLVPCSDFTGIKGYDGGIWNCAVSDVCV